jgi:hypothetical protein
MKNDRCAVLVPVYDTIDRECERGLRALEERGYSVRRDYGCSAIDLARNRMASRALRDGFEELMWIDSDMVFDPGAVDRLRAHNLPMVAGICPKKGEQAINCAVLPDTESITFGEKGGLLEVRYVGLAFVLTHRSLYEDIQKACELPICGQRHGTPFVPFFQPLVIPDGDGHWYLTEDYAFCERARRAGHRIMTDTSIRLHHIGRYPYSYEDAGSTLPRFSTFRLKVKKKSPPT